jgi:O-antigen ligase
MQAATTWWDSRWARWLDFIAVIAAVLVVLRVGAEEDLSWVLWAFVGLAVIVLSLVRWPYGALICLVGLSTMTRFYMELFGWKVRPEHVGATIVAVLAGAWLIKNKTRVRPDTLDYWVLAYLAANYFSSLFTSPDASATFRWALLNNLGVLPYFAIRFIVRDGETLQGAFRILLGVSLVQALYGISCYFSHLVFNTNTGMEIGQYLVDVAAPYGSLYEPNFFGSYTACCAVMMLALYLSQARNRLFYMVSFLIASFAAFISFSRGALLALFVTVVWLFWKVRKRNAGTSRNVPALALALALLVLIALAVSGAVLRERLTNSFAQGLTEETTLTRLLVLAEATQDIINHPIFGSGTASFQLFFDWGNFVPEWAGAAAWIGNFPMRIIHDTGVVGFAMILGFIFTLIFKIRKAWRKQRLLLPVLFALTAGGFLYAISFQFTEGTTLAFCWVHLGFLATTAILMAASQPQGLEPTSGLMSEPVNQQIFPAT